VEERIRQIELNLERRRWMPRDLGSPHLLVNIPGFELQVVEAGRTARTMRVIVGRKSRPTPVLSSELTYLEVNPYWNVPARIARVDLLPKIQENPSFLVRENFRVFSGWGEGARELDPNGIDWSSIRPGHFPFRLRQEPSAQNALGRVKFMFPNDQSVYLHDTPSKNLFRRSIRTLSSGCVRLEEPLELAAFLLERQDWAPERVSRLAASGRRRVVLLERPVPVHFVYLTSWVDEGGGLHFREDVYGHDRRLQLALAQAASAGSSGGTAAQAPQRLVRAAPGGHPPL
jgi:murein L,D-transpeptidase YcbB/YkuD